MPLLSDYGNMYLCGCRQRECVRFDQMPRQQPMKTFTECGNSIDTMNIFDFSNNTFCDHISYTICHLVIIIVFSIMRVIIFHTLSLGFIVSKTVLAASRAMLITCSGTDLSMSNTMSLSTDVTDSTYHGLHE